MVFFEQGGNYLCDGVTLPNRKPPEVPVIFVEGLSMSQSQGKSPVRQFLAALYLVDLEESPAVTLEEVASIDLLAGAMESTADWNLGNLTRGRDLGSLPIFCGNYNIFVRSAPWLGSPFLLPSGIYWGWRFVA